VPTAPWAIYRRGAPVLEAPCPPAVRWVIKPNASSASWGVGDATDWAGVRDAIGRIHAEGHDALVEPFVEGSDVEVPVITVGEPVILPKMIFRQADPGHLRTYYEKRDLVDRSAKYSLDPFEDEKVSALISDYTARLYAEYRPFDYGRFEFRVNETTGEVTFLEVNLNCNLWSEKVFGRAAALAGLTHSQLIETILADSLRRWGLIA
jgi:D-alanine-D-alanine ligase